MYDVILSYENLQLLRGNELKVTTIQNGRAECMWIRNRLSSAVDVDIDTDAVDVDVDDFGVVAFQFKVDALSHFFVQQMRFRLTCMKYFATFEAELSPDRKRAKGRDARDAEILGEIFGEGCNWGRWTGRWWKGRRRKAS